ncbi:Uncharacterized conserved protein YndB, AHSA1/START domain [Solimonas aquatica]|uniref:Uncharacterized conserved protein YndB, AHSA1/START domain n=1 Tax=Solimonas aquatica TaxID=489703 RepID=A0A1H9K131_9GAMM|nr:SRPBCC family protein [Solimonas aquatica]SEQ92822.1 Uncharacterized conserved protein YndB, AHSA1/START domain [Solimonas aquatica]
MSQQELRFEEQIAAPIESVFELLADHQRFVALFGSQCTVTRPGDDRAEPNGCGSVRRIGPGALSFDETIVHFERPTRIDYVISRGSPLKNHLGSLRLSAQGGGTRLDYIIRFEGRLPLVGKLVAAALREAWRRNARARLRELERSGG